MAKSKVTTIIPEETPKQKIARSAVIQNKFWESEGVYEFDESFKPADMSNGYSVHTTTDLVKFVEKNPNTEVVGSVLTINKKGQLGPRTLIKNRESFVKTFKKSESHFKENTDYFGMDAQGGNGSIVGGPDFVPTLGGPFNKQLYMADYLRMNATCFYAYNHDPIAKQAVNIIRDFTLGRGCKITSPNKGALAVIRAWEKVNDLETLLNHMAIELSVYGEIMVWELPHGETKIQQQLKPGQEAPKGIIPRYRLIDPSCIWEIVTFPEDITRVLYYQWVAPTQYQMYGGKSAGQSVSNFKFIYQQIPAGEVMHYKINSVSNEKRGRSDLFPVLGYLKRLRDSVEYSVIAMQKAAAWAIDTTVEGSQADIDAYVESQQELSSIAPAGSEFVHTKAVTRQYLANQGRGAASPEAFQWCLSMIASGFGVPIQYFGTHLSNSGTRASALIATEPVAKKFELRQGIYERIIREMVTRTLVRFGFPDNTEFEVSFPEIVTSDRSQKIKDLSAAEAAQWISKERAATLAAQELGITDYEYNAEFAGEPKTEIAPEQAAPLTAEPKVNEQPAEKARGVSSEYRKDVLDNGRTL